MGDGVGAGVIWGVGSGDGLGGRLVGAGVRVGRGLGLVDWVGALVGCWVAAGAKLKGG